MGYFAIILVCCVSHMFRTHVHDEFIILRMSNVEYNM